MFPRNVPFLRLWAATFLGYVALGATLQILPEYLTARFALGPAGVAGMIAVASVAAAMMRIVAGGAADGGASRRVVLLGSLCGVLGGMAHTFASGLPVLVLGRLCLGAGEASLFTGAVAWVLQGTAAVQRGRTAGWFGLSMWAGIAVGPFLAVGVMRLGGARAVFTGVTLLPVVAMLLVATTTSPPAPATSARARRFRLPRSARTPSLAVVLASYGYGLIAALLLLRLEAAGLGGRDECLALFAAVFLVARTFGSPLVDRFGGRAIWATFGLFEALGLALVAVGMNALTVLGGVALTAAGVSLLYPAAVEIVIGASAAGEHGAGMGVLTAAWDVGLLSAGITGGLVASGAGYETAFGLGAVLVLGSIAVVMRAVPSRDAVRVPPSVAA
jgi:MFS family permease